MTLDLRRGSLIVSLPTNDATLAQAARDAGADFLKVHINVQHLASGTTFGPLAHERDRLLQILAVGLPTGLVPGEETMISPAELPQLRAMGFAFLDAFVDVLPAYLYEVGLPIIPALPHSIAPRYLEQVRALPGLWVEAAIVAPQEYGQPPVPDDFAALRIVAAATQKQLIVPTQRAIQPSDLSRYFALPEVTALTIGAVVTGADPVSLGRTTQAFRRALDQVAA